MDGLTGTSDRSQQQPPPHQRGSGSTRPSQSHLGRSSPPPSSNAAGAATAARSQSAAGKRQWAEVSGVEHGVVASVKDGKYAFISCADREGPELFFHLSDLAEPSDGIQRGDEVSFVVCCDAADSSAAPSPAVRYFAKRVSRVAPGTVSFERVDERAVRGVVEAELKKPNRGARGAVEGYGGRIRRADGGSATLEFAERDLLDWPCLPAAGDVVSFDVFTEKRSNRQGATAVRLIALNPAGRQRGVVSVLKDGYGFIRPEDAPVGNRELFFHFSALVDSSSQPALGDEIEFDTQRDEQQGRLSAQRVAQLPKGSIKRDSVAPDRLVGVVDRDFVAADHTSAAAGSSDSTASSPSQPPSSSSFSSSSAAAVRRSAIRYYPSSPSSLPAAPSSADSALVDFCSLDCRDARPILLKGDVVSFQLLTRGKSGERRPVNVALLQPTAGDREQGKVVSVNAHGGFAFIRRAAREGELFMHASNYKQPSDGSGDSSAGSSTPFVAEGTEVEYSVWLADNGRLCAVRGVPIPAGTVSFERLLDGSYRGTVIREPRRRDRGRASAFERQRSGDQATTQDERGEIRVNQSLDMQSDGAGPLPTGMSPFTVTFSISASAASQSLLVGDSVDCRVAVHNWSGVHAARDVRLHQLRSSPAQECGVVQQLPASNGRGGRIACQHSGVQLPFDSHHVLDPRQADQLSVGDSVQFDCVELPPDSAASSSRRSTGGSSGSVGSKERRVAARLSLLPHGSVRVESVDRSVRFRGRVEDIPSNPKSSKQTAGHILLLSSTSNSQAPADDANNEQSNGSIHTAQRRMAEGSTANQSDTAALAPPASAASSSSNATVPLSLSSLSQSSAPPPPSSSPLSVSVEAVLGSLVEFRFRDIVGNSFLAKGDPVEFFAVTAASVVRAAEVSLLPLQATVAALPAQHGGTAAADGGGSGASNSKSGKATLGHLSILPVSTATAAAASASSPSAVAAAASSGPNKAGSSSLQSLSSSSPSSGAPSASVPPSSASYLDESVVFAASDVLGGAALSVGDVVSIGGMHFNYDRKRRQARLISLVKAAPRASQTAQQQAASERRSKRAGIAGLGGGVGGEPAATLSSLSATTTMRFARGPDDSRGFASRRGAGRQGVSVGLQKASSNSTAAAATLSAAASGPSSDGLNGVAPLSTASSAAD